MTDVMDDHGTKEYQGHDIYVRRVDVETTDYRRSTDYEFELFINGEFLTTATQIEHIGWESPWVDALFRYGKAYVHGLGDQ